MLRGLAWPDGSPLVLEAADPADPPHLAGLQLAEVENVVIDGLVLDYTYADGDPHHLRPFRIDDSRNVTLRHTVVDGDVARGVSPESDGFPWAYGLAIRGSSGVTLEDSEIRGFYRGLTVADSRDLAILRNDVHGLRMDGMDFAQVQRVVIEGNRIHDFLRSIASKDHADMIQFWTNGTDAPTSDVTIRGNLLNSGHGFWTQSIFMRNEEVDRGGPATRCSTATLRSRGTSSSTPTSTASRWARPTAS